MIEFDIMGWYRIKFKKNNSYQQFSHSTEQFEKLKYTQQFNVGRLIENKTLTLDQGNFLQNKIEKRIFNNVNHHIDTFIYYKNNFEL